jgi:hypothetical protein
MPYKVIVLYDDFNNPLKVHGIRVELFDAIHGTLVSTDNSENLDSHLGSYSDRWGVRLNFPSSNNPLDVYITDPTYKYPGNAVRYLNGQLQNDVRIDLLQQPTKHGGQPSAPKSGKIEEIINWIKLGGKQQGGNWNQKEQEAVLNLTTNYVSVILPKIDQLITLTALAAVAENWEAAMSQLKIPVDLLKV